MSATRLWETLVEFGLLDGAPTVNWRGRAVSGRASGRRHLASVPFLGSVGVRYALAPLPPSCPDGSTRWWRDSGVSIALLEPGGGWSMSTSARPYGRRLTGVKAAVEHARALSMLAVVAIADAQQGLALVAIGLARQRGTPQSCLDAGDPLSRVTFADVEVEAVLEGDPRRPSSSD